MKKILLKLLTLTRGLRRRLRTKYYSFLFKKMGKNCNICDKVIIYGPENISLGNNVTINDAVIIQSCEGAPIEIGNRVNIAYGSVIITGSRDFSISSRTNDQKHISRPVIIEDDVVVNARAIILPGIRIGSGSVVAAGSLVTQDIKSKTMVFGVPAKVIKIYDSEPKSENT